MRSNSILNAVQGDDIGCAQFAIPAVLDSLFAAMSALENNVELLRDRLAPVLSTEPSREGDGKLRSSHSVPLAEQLSSLVDRIESLNYRTLDALDRLHV